MGMKISEKGLKIIKEFEGCRLQAYKCPAGIWTIGYGHTSGVKSGMTITQAQADEYLKADCASSENAVNCYYDIYKWNQNQFDALVSFTFNCGAGNLKTLLNGGKRTIAEISNKITAYNKGGGVVLKGLVRRRATEKVLFDTPTGGETVSEPSTLLAPSYIIGKVYTTQVEVNVRKAAGTGAAKMGHSGLTQNAKQNDRDRDGAIDKGTKVTCKSIKKIGEDIWMEIPSGWIAAYYNGEIYVK